MRGNPVMKSKRVTGPTPNTAMLTRMRSERCNVAGCENYPIRVIPHADRKCVRECSEHLGSITK